MAPFTGGPVPLAGELARMRAIGLEFTWRQLGEIKLDIKSRLAFPIKEYLEEYQRDLTQTLPSETADPLDKARLRTVEAEVSSQDQDDEHIATFLDGIEIDDTPMGVPAVYRLAFLETRDDWDGSASDGDEIAVCVYVGQTGNLETRMQAYRSPSKPTDQRVNQALREHLDEPFDSEGYVTRRAMMSVAAAASITTQQGRHDLHLLVNLERLLVEGAAVFDLIEFGNEYPQILNEISG
jgi:hypothetical protein